jgi:acetylornithine deacetylase/succinyl-diaminopimelate desuccinylase-like protein
MDREKSGHIGFGFEIDTRETTMDRERIILDFLQSREDALLQFTRDLIATPSWTPPGEERAVAERMQQELETLRLGRAEVIARKPERPNLSRKLFGARPGPRLMYCGHMDTKPPGNRAEWSQDPHDPVIQDGKLHGLGCGDMKAGIAAMVYAAAALANVRDAVDGQLELLFTADEEGGAGMGARFLAANGHVRGDAMLISESSGVRRELEFISFDGRGSALFRIRVHGDQMHSSLSDEFNAVNASVKAAGLLDRFAREFKLPGTTVNTGVTLQGGVFFGVVPGLAEFGCDLRVPPGSTETFVRSKVQAWLEGQHRQDPELRAELEWILWVDPVAFPNGHSLAAALQQACRTVLRHVPPARCYPAGTDAPWFVAAGVPTIPAFGPGRLPLAHSPNEWVEIASIFACARIYALTALNFLSSVGNKDPHETTAQTPFHR